MTEARSQTRSAPGSNQTQPPVLITLAPAPTSPGTLLRSAIDAAQVGATRIHLAAEQPDLAHVIGGLRAQTELIVTLDQAAASGSDLVDRLPSGFVEIVLDHGAAPAELVGEVARIAADQQAHPAGVSLGGRSDAGLPVLLAALAAGAHVRVGTADTPTLPASPGESLRGHPAPQGRGDAALVARASGLARIAGRAPMTAAAARSLWRIG